MGIGEPYLKLVPSVIQMGKRIRTIGSDRIHRHPEETFHDFLFGWMRLHFGKEWWLAQEALPSAKQHAVVGWWTSLLDWRLKNQTESNELPDGRWVTLTSGTAQTILQLAYDLFCVKHLGKLTDTLMNRLRDLREFQGARYEICVAAIFARAGFQIDWCGEVPGEKICEFIATHFSGVEVAVEAKSRRRPGIIHQKGIEASEYRADLKNIYASARKKKPIYPFVIFLDANMPPTPDVPWEESPKLQDIKDFFDDFPEPTAERPDAHNLVVISNFCFHFKKEDLSDMDPTLYIKSLHPKYPYPEAVWESIYHATQQYSQIPEQV